jgi:hypothetical protein
MQTLTSSCHWTTTVSTHFVDHQDVPDGGKTTWFSLFTTLSAHPHAQCFPAPHITSLPKVDTAPSHCVVVMGTEDVPRTRC